MPMVVATITAYEVTDPTARRRSAVICYRDARRAELEAQIAYFAAVGSAAAVAAREAWDRAVSAEADAYDASMTPYQRNLIVSGGSVESYRSGPQLIRHGGSDSPEYKTLQGMIRRCTDPADKHFASYGGKGVTVHPLWVGEEGFVHFYEHVGPRPLGGDHSIDRIDPRLPYEPGNVRWATSDVQYANKRGARRDRLGVDDVVTAMGASRSVLEWAAEFRCSCTRLAYALVSKPGVGAVDRVVSAFGHVHSVGAWAAAFGCSSTKLDAALATKPTMASSSRRERASTQSFVMDWGAVERYRFEKRVAAGEEAARMACRRIIDQNLRDFALKDAVELALSIEQEIAHSSGTDPLTALYVEVQWVDVERRRRGLL